MHERGELRLADHFRALIVGAGGGGSEGREGGGIELGRFARGGDELAVAVDEQRTAGVRVPEKRLEVRLDLLEIVFVERPARGPGHAPPQVTRSRTCRAVPPAPGRWS